MKAPKLAELATWWETVAIECETAAAMGSLLRSPKLSDELHFFSFPNAVN